MTIGDVRAQWRNGLYVPLQIQMVLHSFLVAPPLLLLLTFSFSPIKRWVRI